MEILVTGGAGFIGSNLIDVLLKQGHTIINVDNFNNFYPREIKEKNIKTHFEHQKYKLYNENIENVDALRKIFAENKIDCVVHLAARAGVRPSIENPIEYAKTNILGTMNILELMKEFGVQKMVFGSSSSVYGNCKEIIFSESLKVTEPISPYAATKSACEQICYTYHSLYNLNIICLRFFTVYGPRQRPDLAINKFVRCISQGQSIPVYGDGTTQRDYTFVNDIVYGIINAMNYDKTPYEIINIGGGEPITLNKMIETIENILGKKAIIERLPMQAGDVEKTACDWSKAKRLLNYEPKITFKDGLTKFVEWRANE